MDRPKLEFVQMGQGPYFPSSTLPGMQRANLRVQTSNNPAPQAPSPSPSDPPYPRYPISIPPDKQEKALRLYMKFETAEQKEGLAQRQEAAPQPAHNYLTVPGSSAPHSTASCTSSGRQRAHSLSTTGDATTDISSIVSFGGDESPSSANARQGDPKAFDGKTVKQRKRKPFSPKSKAKTALVRYLGSCWVCRKRAVPCPLDHFDIECLKRLRSANIQSRQRRPRSMHQQRPSNSIALTQHARSISSEQMTALPQNNDLFLAIGQNPQLLQSSMPYGNQLEIQSPGGLDPLAGISSNSAPFYPTSSADDPIGQTLYSQYQDGAMFAVGVFREASFQCQFLGLCSESFPNQEALQLHFEQAHFPYTRIDPACCIVCKSCQYIEPNMNELTCQSCQKPSQLEMWIYGRFMRVSEWGRHSSDGGDAFIYTPTSASYAASYDGLGFDGSRNGDVGGDGNAFQGSPHTQSFDFQNFGMGGSEYRENDPFFPGQSGHHANLPPSSRYQGHNFSYRIVTQHKHTKFRSPIYPKTKTLAILIFLLAFSSISISLTLIFTLTPVYEWITSFFQRLVPSASEVLGRWHAHIPAVAFMSLVGSFAMCSSVQRAGFLRHTRFLAREKVTGANGIFVAETRVLYVEGSGAV
ncbi:hypothetical protein HYALB_00005833 [Hymenoscyphus albidus]|uniref:C2H2-type domain-containing protein n=1 Tax=Hymenoscyphus albidus TaxID=595503 RepID=A0A9N9LK35_9HELO|nr:hypothetical protein HYALB_00005833 [Hymenoscyphus albidus]